MLLSFLLLMATDKPDETLLLLPSFTNILSKFLKSPSSFCSFVVIPSVKKDGSGRSTLSSTSSSSISMICSLVVLFLVYWLLNSLKKSVSKHKNNSTFKKHLLVSLYCESDVLNGQKLTHFLIRI